MSEDPKSSGSSTSSEGLEGSDSDSKGLVKIMGGHQNSNTKRRVQSAETAWALDQNSRVNLISFGVPEATLRGKKLPNMGSPPKPRLEETHPLTAKDRYFVASATARSTRTPSRSTIRTSEKATSQLTLENSTLDPYRTLISYARGFLASPSAWRGRGGAFRTHGVPSSLRSLESLKSGDLGSCCLRMSRDSSATTKEGPSGPSSPVWMRWGMMLSGRCLTANITESRKTGRGSSLSDILEESPGGKYFLSDKALKSLLAHDQRHKEAGNGFGAWLKGKAQG